MEGKKDRREGGTNSSSRQITQDLIWETDTTFLVWVMRAMLAGSGKICNRTKLKKVDSQLLLYKYLIQLIFGESFCNEPDQEIEISVISPRGK